MTLVPKRFRQLTTAAVIAIALATGANTVALTAIASAERVWDIERYDGCMLGGPIDSLDDKYKREKFCCGQSGGVWNGADCVAPPASPQDSSRGPGLRPPRVPIDVLGPAQPDALSVAAP
ncbi:hypothetical protein ABGB19_20190 [Mycobacterium sp. B14F4]|uniref:hypothetical protein n=1 Tax=Mycobacterium sp. B14F4 TaxID=3153565 RepID=UPI00325E9C08